MLLFLMKHSRHNISNMTRDQSKANNDANSAAFGELQSVIRSVLDTKKLGLKLEPPKDASKLWEIVCFSKIDYAGNPISMRGRSGFII